MTLTLNDFLVWLVGGGAVAFFSWFSERNAWFQTLDPDKKWWFQLGGSTVIALAAWAVQTYVPPEVLSQIAPAFGVVSGVVGLFLANQVVHKISK